MNYEGARTALAAVLQNVAIEAPPATAQIKKVYEDPPATIGDVPCFILYGSQGEAQHPMGGMSLMPETHTERVRLLVKDAKAEQAAAIVRAFRVATLRALASAGGLGGEATVDRITWEEPAGFNYGGGAGSGSGGGAQNFTGQDYLITFHVTQEAA